MMTIEQQLAKLSGKKQKRRKRGELRWPVALLRLKNEFFAAHEDGERDLAQALLHELTARLRCIQLLQRTEYRLNLGTADAFEMLDVLEESLRAGQRAPRAPRTERDYSAEVAELIKNRIDIRPYPAPWSLREAFDLLVEFHVGRTDTIGRAFGINRRRASAYLSMARARAKLAAAS